VLAGIVAINIIAGELNLKLDLTPKKLFSLSEQTRTLLKGLQKDVEILALYEPGKEPETIMETVREYELRSDRVKVRVVDPDRQPAELARFAAEETPLSMGSLVVSSGSYFRVISAMDLYDVSYDQQGQPRVMGQKVENQITSALSYVSSGRTPSILEITGHRETPLAEIGYQPLLAQANYVVDQISLVLSDIPDDTALITMIGPRSDLSAAETAKLDTYLASGGSLLAALDYAQDPMPNLYGFLSRWDIEVLNGIVLETRANRLIAEFGDNPIVFAPYIADHEALRPLTDAKMAPIFKVSLGLRRTDAKQRQLEYFSLLSSSEDSRLRTNFTSEASASLDPIPEDLPGPIDVAAAVRQRNPDTYKPEGGTIVVLGSASTLAGVGDMGQIKANADMLINLVNWTMNDDSLVIVPSKSLFRLPLQISTPAALLYTAVAVILLPLFSLVSGIVIYFRRRNK
jgi:hypothetical protein